MEVKLEEFQNSVLTHCEAINELIKANLPQLPVWCLIERVYELEIAVNGTRPRDLVYNPTSDYPDTRRTTCT